MPIRDFEAVIRVEDIDERSSRVVWQARFEPVGISSDDAKALIGGVFAVGLDRLAELMIVPLPGS